MKSIKLALIALLGFSTACSTVKEGSKSKKEVSDKEKVAPSIVVMYGVRRPIEASSEVKKVEQPTPEQSQPSPEVQSQNK